MWGYTLSCVRCGGNMACDMREPPLRPAFNPPPSSLASPPPPFCAPLAELFVCASDAQQA
eukprot:1095606-Pleurochrysis_carterae.AAC.1